MAASSMGDVRACDRRLGSRAVITTQEGAGLEGHCCRGRAVREGVNIIKMLEMVTLVQASPLTVTLLGWPKSVTVSRMSL